MPQVSFGTKNEPTFQLEKSADLIAVRTRSRRSLRAGPVQPAATAALDNGIMELALPEAGVEVYRVPPEKKSLADRKALLARDPDVRFAGGVLVDETGQPVLYTENLFVKFIDTVDRETAARVIRDAGLLIKQELEYAQNSFFVAAPEGTGEKVFEIAQDLLKRPDVEYCHPELIRRKQRRAIFDQQWHLKPTSAAGTAISAHANVEAAHRLTRGEGIVIAVIDDGVDVDHPEFAGPGKVIAPRDATFPLSHPQGRDPRPKDTDPTFPDNHGTACAGVACAAGVDGASGVAPASKLLPIRLAAGLGSQQEANAFHWAADNGADVISCSWGPTDGEWWNDEDPKHQQSFPLPPSTRLAIEYAATRGRGGKGCVVLFAAGNGNESVSNDGYASCQSVIAVAACNDRSRRSVYSDMGPEVWCSFPSSDFGWPEQDRPEPLTPGIWTTDRMARRGYNPGVTTKGDVGGSYTSSFGGTSSACPGAAGVVALMLSVNPDLKAHEVKELIKHACDKIDPQGGQYQESHSPLYGYGRLNAEAAVIVAQPRPRQSLIVSQCFNLILPDLQSTEASLHVSSETVATDVRVHVQLLHSYIGDLVLTLVPPPSSNLSEAVLHNRRGGAAHDLDRVFDRGNTPALGLYRNIACDGTWKLRISDEAAEDAGVLVTFGIELDFEQPAAPAVAPRDSRRRFTSATQAHEILAE